MRLGISSYTYVWAARVPGYPAPGKPLTAAGLHTYVWAARVPGYPAPGKPLTAAGLLEKAAELGVDVVQIADNLPLDRLSSAEIDELASQARDRKLRLEVGTCGIEPGHLRTYLNLAASLHSPLVRVVIDTDTSQPSPN